MSDTIELTERQRRRLEEIKEECTEGGRVPPPADQEMFSSLLDTWDAVDDGLYSGDREGSGSGGDDAAE